MNVLKRAISLVLTASILGCGTAAMTNTVVGHADNPDGQFSALLVERYYRSALNADEFFLVLVRKGQNPNEAINNKDIGNSSALVATNARQVMLKWEDSGTLLVICDSCGIKAIDVSKELDHYGAIKIVYQGFPAHTAYL